MSRKKSLSDKLAELANPTPKFIDPEDDFNEETNARLEQYDDEDFSQSTKVKKAVKTKPNLRQKNAAILADTDRKYAGRRISRSELELQDDDEDEDDDDDHEDENYGDDGDSNEDTDKSAAKIDNSDGEEESGKTASDDENDAQIQEFLSMMKAKSSTRKKTAMNKTTASDYEEEIVDTDEEDGYDLQGEEEEDGEDEEDVEDEEDEDEDEDEEDQDDDADGEDEEDYEEEEDGDNQNEESVVNGGSRKSSKQSTATEVEKGKAIQSQLSFWDYLLECRIKLHKGIHLANQLPQGPAKFKTFIKAGDARLGTAVKETQTAVRTLLDSLLELQDLALKSNPQTKTLLKGKSNDIKDDESDEEIPSDTEDEAEGEAENDDDPGPLKKKMKVAEYETEIQMRHERFQNYSHRVLQLWNEKTRLASGRAGSKAGSKSGGFGAFEQSILKQIEIILADKQRLINRTRIKRSAYRILATEPKSDRTTSDKEGDDKQLEEEAPPADKAKEEDEFDAEIYDDDDFYHQLLRELIERRTGEGGSDQVSIGRQWLEIQKLRSKAKRKVDPKASKGRRLRFHVHPKLVSLMAPHPETSWNDAAKNELFASLFSNA